MNLKTILYSATTVAILVVSARSARAEITHVEGPFQIENGPRHFERRFKIRVSTPTKIECLQGSELIRYREPGILSMRCQVLLITETQLKNAGIITQRPFGSTAGEIRQIKYFPFELIKTPTNVRFAKYDIGTGSTLIAECVVGANCSSDVLRRAIRQAKYPRSVEAIVTLETFLQPGGDPYPEGPNNAASNLGG